MSAWNDLIELLAEEESLCQKFLSLLQEDRLVIIDPSIEEIYKRVKEKEILALRFKVLEESRMRLLEKILPSENPAFLSHEITLAQLSKVAPAPFKKILKKTQANLLSLSFSIKELNQENKNLITQSLNIVKESLSAILNSLNPDFQQVTYLRSGGVKREEFKRKKSLGKV